MGLIILVDDEELERKTFFNVCVDRQVVEADKCIGVPAPSALVALVKEGGLDPSTMECIFVDLQLNPENELDRGGLVGADLIREVVGNVPIIAYTRHTEIRDFADITAHEFDGILLKQDCSDALRFTKDRFRQLIAGWRKKRRLPPTANDVEGPVEERLSPRILHLSDLQFGRAYLSPRDLADAILAAVSGVDSVPNVVVISGDIAQTGSPKEYEEVLNFLTRLCSGLSISSADRQRVVICPGNHDVSWGLSLGAYVDEKLEKRAIPLSGEPFYRYRLAPFYDFCAEFYGNTGGTGLLLSSRSVQLHDLRAYGLVFVSLNSSCHEDPFNRKGVIESVTFEKIEDALAGFSDRDNFILGAIFHHPLQVGVGAGFAADSSDLIQDPTGVARRLWAAGFRLAFTGHIHASSLEMIPVEAGVRVSGHGLINFLSGSTGVPEDDRPKAGHAGHFANEFSIIRSLGGLTDWELEAYSFDAASRAFLPKPKFAGPSHKRKVTVLGGSTT